MSPYERRVREFAYRIWESEGRPVGHEYRHWEMACKLVDECEALEGSSLNSARQNPEQLSPTVKIQRKPSLADKKQPARKKSTLSAKAKR